MHRSGRRFRLFTLTILTIVFFSACVGSTSQNLDQSTELLSVDCRIVEHSLGKTCVPLEPRRVVALDGATVGNLLALGMMPAGVASNLLPEITRLIPNVPRLGQSSQINLETLAVLQPDLIIGAVWEIGRAHV